MGDGASEKPSTHFTVFTHASTFCCWSPRSVKSFSKTCLEKYRVNHEKLAISVIKRLGKIRAET